MKYCKKLFALLAAALLCMALTLPAGAAAPLVRDECGVFDADTLADLEEQEDEIVPQLSDEEWADAAYTYIDMCDDALDYYADHGEPIDVDNDIGLEDLLIAMIFPLGISAFICLILYHRMKTARQKTEADEYMPGFTLRVKRDRYTHTTRERTYDPPQKESHSSGGSSVDSDGFGGSSGGSF